MNRFTILRTPFYDDGGNLLHAGRPLQFLESKERFTDQLLAGTIFQTCAISKSTQPRALEIAFETIENVFKVHEKETHDIPSILEEWSSMSLGGDSSSSPDSRARDDDESDEVTPQLLRPRETSRAPERPEGPNPPVSSEEKLARVAANRVLLKMADDEITRIKKESQPNDLLVAALKRQEQLATHKAHKLMRLIRAYRYVLPDMVTADAVRSSYTRVAIRTTRAMSTAELFSLKAEMERYLDTADALHEVLELPPVTEREKAALYRAVIGTTKLGAWLRQKDLTRDPDADPLSVADIGAFLDRCLRQRELVESSSPTVEATPAAVFSSMTTTLPDGQKMSRQRGTARGHDASQSKRNKQSKKCFVCGKPGHLARDCTIKPVGPIKPPERKERTDNEQRTVSTWNRSSLSAVALPAPAFVATRSDAPTTYVFDTGAAVVSYVPTLAGMDVRTLKHFDSPHHVYGVGGDTQSACGGTVYLCVGNNEHGTPIVIRFDALLLEPVKVGLISNSSMIYDGGLHSFTATCTKPFGEIDDQTVCREAIIRLGAVGAQSDPEKSIQIRLKLNPETLLFTLPVVHPLSQEQIEALVPLPPDSLSVATTMLGLRTSVTPALLGSQQLVESQTSAISSQEHSDIVGEDDAQAAFVELHFRLGHRHPKEMKKICAPSDWHPLFNKLMDNFVCEVCARRRLRNPNRPSPRFVQRSQNVCARLYLDTIPVPDWPNLSTVSDAIQICSPPHHVFVLNNRYSPSLRKPVMSVRHVLVIVDEYSKFGWTVPLENKNSDTIKFAFEHFLTVWLPLIRDQRSHSESLYFEEDPSYIRLNTVHTDAGSEFEGDFTFAMNTLGICRSSAPPHQQYKNGVVEGRIRDLKGLVRTYYDAHGRCTPTDFAMYCEFAMTQLNLLPTRTLGASPYFVLFGRAPQLSWCRDFGAMGYVHAPDDSLTRGRKVFLRGIKFGNPERGFEFVFADTGKSTVVHDARFIPKWVQTVKQTSGQDVNASDVDAQHPAIAFTPQDSTTLLENTVRTDDKDSSPPTSPARSSAPVTVQSGDDSGDEDEDGHPLIENSSKLPSLSDATRRSPGDRDGGGSSPPLALPPEPLPGDFNSHPPLEGATSEVESSRIEREVDTGLPPTQETHEPAGLNTSEVQTNHGEHPPIDGAEVEIETTSSDQHNQQSVDAEGLRKSSRSNAGKPPARFLAGCSVPNEWESDEETCEADDHEAHELHTFEPVPVFHAAHGNTSTSLDPRIQEIIQDISLWPLETKFVMLDLCSGGRSVERALKLASVDNLFNVKSFDSDPTTRPSLLMCVLELAQRLRSGDIPEEIRGLHVRFIWASPPCTALSAANTGRDPETAEREMRLAEQIVEACIDIIWYFVSTSPYPVFWAVENPDSGRNRLSKRLSMILMQRYLKTATYCHYGRQDRKATAIYTNVTRFSPRDCRREPCLTRHLLGHHVRTAQAGPSVLRDGTVIPGTPRIDSQRVPEALIQQWLLDALLESQVPLDPQLHRSLAYAVSSLHLPSELGRPVRRLSDASPQEIDAAKKREIDGLYRSKRAFTIVPTTNRDRNAPVLQYVWVMKIRSDDTVKARLCIGGHRQIQGDSFWETSSPTPRATTVRIALGLAAQNGWNVWTADVAQAYVAADLGVLMYMKPPPEFKSYLREEFPTLNTGDDFLLQVNKSLYGAKQAGLLWHRKCATSLRNRLGYTQCSKDPCLFFKRNTDGTLSELILVYVDDFLFLGTSTSYETFLKRMREEYELSTSPSDKLVVWNGLEIERQGTTIHVTQVSKVREMSREFAPLLVQFGLAGNPKTPHPEFTAEDLFNPAHAITPENATKEELNTLHLYQRVVGALMYIAVYTRFDISYAIGRAARLMHCASEEHLRGAARLLRYVIDHEQIGLTFRKSVCVSKGEPRIFCFVDSNYGNEPPNTMDHSNLGRKSTSAIVIMGFGSALYWKSKLQNVVATSTGEAEFRAAFLAIKEIIFITHLMCELGFSGYNHGAMVPLFSDSMCCVKHFKRDGVSWLEGTKQYEIELSAAYQRCVSGDIIPIKIKGTDNPADLLSKSNLATEQRNLYIQRISGNKCKTTFQDWIRDKIVTQFDGTDMGGKHGLISLRDLLLKNGLL